jgi:hypothetical protein
LALLAPNRAPDSYIAGATALHFSPNSTRFSRDVDIFHDSVELVAEAFAKDRSTLEEDDYTVATRISQPGFIRALVGKSDESTLIDWARESTWRFMPIVQDKIGGYRLHDIDLATNKVIALAGRNEPRDFIDTLDVLDHILALGPLVWAAVDKDPGFSPVSLLEMLRRRGRYRPEEFERLDLVAPIDPVETKMRWIEHLDKAERFIESRLPEEVGCLYYSTESGRFVEPAADVSLEAQNVIKHFGRPGGVLPVPAV